MSLKANYFKLGLFVIGAIAAGIIVLIIIGSGRWLQKRITIETYFNESVQGLDIGSKLKYRGVAIGEVTRIGFTYNKYQQDRPMAERRRCIVALRAHRAAQRLAAEKIGVHWRDTGLVFTTRYGNGLLAGNVRRALRPILSRAGLDPDAWTPRELRHSFVSLLSEHGVNLETIADLVGHAGTTVTEKVYRHQLRPVLLAGAVAMDGIFGPPEG